MTSLIDVYNSYCGMLLSCVNIWLVQHWNPVVPFRDLMAFTYFFFFNVYILVFLHNVFISACIEYSYISRSLTKTGENTVLGKYTKILNILNELQAFAILNVWLKDVQTGASKATWSLYIRVIFRHKHSCAYMRQTTKVYNENLIWCALCINVLMYLHDW